MTGKGEVDGEGDGATAGARPAAASPGLRPAEGALPPEGALAAEGALPADVLAACYADMRRIARRIVAGDNAARLLQATELANEAAIRLIRARDLGVASRAHMLVLAARTMRRILIDEGRRAGAAKRHAPAFTTAWPDAAGGESLGLDALDAALEALAGHSPEHARIVELRFMLGLTLEETAAETGLAVRTVKRRWQAARAWLLDHLDDPRDT